MTAALLFLAASLQLQPASAQAPQWIWGAADRKAGQAFCLRGTVDVQEGLTFGRLTALADYCDAAIFVNGKKIAQSEPYDAPLRQDITVHLQPGANELCLCGQTEEGPAAVMLRLELNYRDGGSQQFVSNESWRATPLAPGSLQPTPAGGAKEKPVAVLGAVESYLWTEGPSGVAIQAADNYEQWKQALDAPTGADPQTFQTLPEFEVRLVRTAAEGEDSWVSLAADAQGRWIIAKEKRGLLRLTPAQNASEEARVEIVNDTLAECRGLLFAYDSLYAMANNDRALYRLRDHDGDGRWEEVVRLAEFEGGVGHGRNQITLGPDGAIYCIFGDSVAEPPSARSLPPKTAHPTRHESAPSGFVARTDRDGRSWEVLARGLRNAYGVDFNTEGDLFTYDADAEYDMGASWYRPTRILHLVPGGDFGWRSVTGQWPPYFPDRPDMPRPTSDIGKGSPTAVKFGALSQFPPRYQQALYALDWAYGRILAVHLEPHGSSYRAHAETFLRGKPLNVTDVEFGSDGAMWFITGGRGTRSALYRVAYVGSERTPPAATLQQTARETHAASARTTRRQLEDTLRTANTLRLPATYGARGAPAALETAWSYLEHPDPWIRHVARAVIEAQPVNTWRTRALQEPRLDRALAALLALARMGPSDVQPQILERVHRVNFAALSPRQRDELIFLYERCVPEDRSALLTAQRAAAVQRLDALYPEVSPQANRRLSLLLSRLGVKNFTPRTMALLAQAEDQAERLHYLFVLRNQRQDWTPALRDAYFEQLASLSDASGGEGMPSFRRLIENEALDAVAGEQRTHYSKKLLGNLFSGSVTAPPPEPRPFVNKWTLADFDEPLLADRASRDVERGKEMFAAVQCAACHRVNGEGGVSGPDLTAVARRFTAHDILTSILEPSRVIAENYRNDAFTMNDGRVVVGRVLPGDYRSPELRVAPDLLAPEKTVALAKREIERQQPSPLSPMPTGLLDTLSREEILDLVAYLVHAASTGE